MSIRPLAVAVATPHLCCVTAFCMHTVEIGNMRREMGLDYKVSALFCPKGSRDARVLDAIAPKGDEIVLTRFKEFWRK